MTLLQALDRYKNVLSKAGITKKGLGVTGHGLRHQFAGDKFFDLADVACPVRGGDPLHDPELLERVLLAVSQQLGHNRTQITQAYCGSATGMAKADQPIGTKKDSARNLSRQKTHQSGMFSGFTVGHCANTLELHCGECDTSIAFRENRSHTAFMAACRQALHEVQYLTVLAVRPLLAL